MKIVRAAAGLTNPYERGHDQADCQLRLVSTEYKESVQMKQDRIIPVSRCQVTETIVTQFCGHWSPAGVTRYVHFPEPKALEHRGVLSSTSTEHGKVALGGRTKPSR